MKENEPYVLITPPGKVHGLANGDIFKAVDAERDGMDKDR